MDKIWRCNNAWCTSINALALCKAQNREQLSCAMPSGRNWIFFTISHQRKKGICRNVLTNKKKSLRGAHMLCMTTLPMLLAFVSDTTQICRLRQAAQLSYATPRRPEV